METVFYFAGILTFGFICFGVYKVIKLVEGKFNNITGTSKNPNFNLGELGKEVGRGVVEALEEDRERELRIGHNREKANHQRYNNSVGDMPVISSTPAFDRKVHFNKSDFLIPEGLTEAEKQTLEQFYGKS